MDLKELLVFLDTTAPCATRLELAIELALRHGARLTGLHVTAHHFYEPDQEDARSAVERLREMFVARTGEAGAAGQWLDIDMRVVGADVAEIVNRHAHYADLVILGQTARNPADQSVPGDLPERVVLGSGCPVLVIPYASALHTVGERAMIAWAPGREAARAVRDALPLLKGAEHVCITEIAPHGTGGALLGAHLETHGIGARVKQILATEVGVGDTLLNQISIEGSDLLVMGAYAHSRFGAPVLGEVARHILNHMTVPVLMSH